MYYFVDVPNPESGDVERFIIFVFDESQTWFKESNDDQNVTNYLAWLAEGNTPEPWNPEP